MHGVVICQCRRFRFVLWTGLAGLGGRRGRAVAPRLILTACLAQFRVPGTSPWCFCPAAFPSPSPELPFLPPSPPIRGFQPPPCTAPCNPHCTASLVALSSACPQGMLQTKLQRITPSPEGCTTNAPITRDHLSPALHILDSYNCPLQLRIMLRCVLL